MEEIWKSIDGFEGIYEISNLGRVKSLAKTGSVYTGKGKPRKEYTINETIVKGWSQEYQVVDLRKAGKSHSKKIHRLVAEAFIPNADNKSQVNHIDENKFNNRIDNLEWVTPKENVNHGTGIARRSKTQKKRVIALKGESKITFESIGEAAETLGVDRSCISHTLSKRMSTVKGYTFEYA